MKKSILSIFCILIVGFVSAQSEIQTSQYLYDIASFNPACAGSSKALSVDLLARRQWIGIDQSPSTQILNVHQYLKNINSGIGLVVVNDQLGFEHSLNVKAQYSYYVQLTKFSVLSFGAAFGFVNQSIEGSKLVYESDYLNSSVVDQYALRNNTSVIVPDFDFGMNFNYKNLDLGFSSSHIQQNMSNTEIKLYRHYYAYGKYNIPVSPKFTIIPSIRVKANEFITQTDFGVMCEANQIILFGCSYRLNSAYIGFLGFNLNKDFRLMYSYDYDASKVLSIGGGSHEIGLCYIFHKLNSTPQQYKSPRLVN